MLLQGDKWGEKQTRFPVLSFMNGLTGHLYQGNRVEIRCWTNKYHTLKAFPGTHEILVGTQKKLPSPQDLLNSTKKSTTALRKRAPATRKHSISPRKNLLNKKALPCSQETLPDTKETVTGTQETIPRKQEWLPGISRVHNLESQNGQQRLVARLDR